MSEELKQFIKIMAIVIIGTLILAKLSENNPPSPPRFIPCIFK